MIRCIFIFLIFASSIYAQKNSDWETYYEKSNYLETPRHAETVAYCQRLDAASEWIEYSSFGKSPQGRDLPLVIVDRNGNFTPEAVKQSGNAVVLFQSCIHAGEPDGKDASLMLMRELAISKKLSHLLEQATVLFIPIFNVDGHENFSAFNRINQNGPKETGFRVTAQRLNLNRDFLKAESPEMQAWLKFFNQWLPDFMVDNHVTNGADHQYALTYGIEYRHNLAEPLRRWTLDVMEPFLDKRMKESGQKMMRYFSINRRPDIKDGLNLNQYYSPRFSTGYGAAQNRAFLLVETHMLKDYKTRVTANYHLMIHILELVNKEHASLLNANRLSDKITVEQFSGNIYPLNFQQNTQDTLWRPFLGVEYEVVDSDISGGKWVQYSDKPKAMQLPFFEYSIVSDSAKIPYAYLIPPQWQFHINKIAEHGVTVNFLRSDTTLAVESYRFQNVQWPQKPFEGRFLPSFQQDTVQEKRFYPAGTAVILMNQRTNRVIAHLLEPNAPDSFLRWGYWNNIFERKEYTEDYTMEKMARQMIAENPGLKAEFEQALANNPGMAENRWARLYFFYARTQYWETDINLYPVGKLITKTDLPLSK